MQLEVRGGVTFGVIGSSFFYGNVSNCWLNSYGGAVFFAVCEKPQDNRPPPPSPAVRGLKHRSAVQALKHD